jgi:hypothetical protein
VANQIATRVPRPWTAPTATAPVTTTVRLPGSKSMTARALVLSGLADGPSTVNRPLRARDTELMASALRALGVDVVTSDEQRWLIRPGSLPGLPKPEPLIDVPLGPVSAVPVPAPSINSLKLARSALSRRCNDSWPCRSLGIRPAMSASS